MRWGEVAVWGLTPIGGHLAHTPWQDWLTPNGGEQRNGAGRETGPVSLLWEAVPRGTFRPSTRSMSALPTTFCV